MAVQRRQAPEPLDQSSRNNSRLIFNGTKAGGSLLQLNGRGKKVREGSAALISFSFVS